MPVTLSNSHVSSCKNARRTPLLMCGVLVSSMSMMAGCGVELTQGNSEPFVVGVGPVVRAETTGIINIFYAVADFQNDDAYVEVSVCTDSACFSPQSSRFGAGTLRVPTVGVEPNAYSASHVFSWAYACPSLNLNNNQYSVIGVDDSFTVRVKVVTSDSEPVTSSSSYTLKDLGITQMPAYDCSRL